jgi:hypothetical protein
MKCNANVRTEKSSCLDWIRITYLWIDLSIELSRFPDSLWVFYTIFSDQLILILRWHFWQIIIIVLYKITLVRTHISTQHNQIFNRNQNNNGALGKQKSPITACSAQRSMAYATNVDSMHCTEHDFSLKKMSNTCISKKLNDPRRLFDLGQAFNDFEIIQHQFHCNLLQLRRDNRWNIASYTFVLCIDLELKITVTSRPIIHNKGLFVVQLFVWLF